jgi:hypothetical protein
MRLLICSVMVATSIMILSTTALAATEGPASRSTKTCAGLDCQAGPYIPEAHGLLPVVSDFDELIAQPHSGFYKMPALAYKGETPPQTVVYLAKAGQNDRMPQSITGLPFVEGFTRTSDPSATTLVVADPGLVYLVPSKAESPESTASLLSERCNEVVIDRVFCIYQNTEFGGTASAWDGPTYTGTGWWNLGRNGSLSGRRHAVLCTRGIARWHLQQQRHWQRQR